MKSIIVFFAFMIFSFGSVMEDVRCYCVRSNELAIGIAAVIIIKLLLGGDDWAGTLGGGSIGVLSLALVSKLSMGRLGSGDIWFSALIGFSFGFWVWNACIFIAAFLGAIWIGCRRISSPQRPSLWHIRIPFAPFMFIGAIAVSIYRGLSQ